MTNQKLVKTVLMLLIPILIVVILRYGKPFLVPLTFAALLAMLLLPVCKWLEKKGIHKAIAILIAILILMSFFAGVIAFVSWQVSDISKNATELEQQITTKYQQVQEFISDKLGVPLQKQEAMMKEQQSATTGKLGSIVTGTIAGIGSLLTDTLLVLVYIFLLIYFRGHIKRLIIRLTPAEDEEMALDIISRSQQVTHKYLTGLLLMIVSLWVMYSIGFSITGVNNAIFFAILCGLLEIVPFVGNFIGNGLTIVMVLIQGGSTNMIIGILVTYALVQFIQTYFLETLVLGGEVNINPLLTIIGLIAGEIVWGIPGMVLAIPVMGVIKIICDHIEPLKPYGEFMGDDKKEKKGKHTKQIYAWIQNFKSSFKK